MLRDFPAPRTMRVLRNTKQARGHRRNLSKACAKEFIAWRKDLPFAAVHLAQKLSKKGCSFVEHYLRVPWDPSTLGFEFESDIGYYLYQYAAAHLSLKDNSKIAVYRTRADHARGREIVMTPGRVYSQAFPEFTNAEVQMFAEKFNTIQYELTTDADVIVEKYQSCKHTKSCMAHPDCEHDYHPVEVYAYPGNGLALAYADTPDGDVAARCLVNTERMKAVRNYGDQRLQKALQQAGYHFNSVEALDGVRLKAIPVGRGLVMPYIDGCDTVHWDGKSDYCTIDDNGDYHAQNTNGHTHDDEEDNNSTECGECQGYFDGDNEGSYSDWHDINLCDGCISNCYTYAIYTARGSETYVRDEDTIEVNGKSFLDSKEVLAAHGIVETHNGEHELRDDCIYLEYLEEYAHEDDCIKLDLDYEQDGYALSNDTTTITLNGEELTVHERYEGPTDESIKLARQVRRRAARLRLFRHRRKYSRHPNTRKRLTMRRKA